MRKRLAIGLMSAGVLVAMLPGAASAHPHGFPEQDNWVYTGRSTGDGCQRLAGPNYNEQLGVIANNGGAMQRGRPPISFGAVCPI